MSELVGDNGSGSFCTALTEGVDPRLALELDGGGGALVQDLFGRIVECV